MPDNPSDLDRRNRPIDANASFDVPAVSGYEPLPSKSERTRRRVLDAAAAVLAERGYVGTRLSDIAELAQMKPGSLYYHFDSKERLIEEVLKYGVRETRFQMEKAIADLPVASSAGDRLRTAILAEVSVAVRTSDYTAAHLRCLSQIPIEIRQGLASEMRKVNELWKTLIVEAVEAGDIRDDLEVTTVHLLIVGAISWIVEWPKWAHRPAEQIGETLAELVLSGLYER